MVERGLEIYYSPCHARELKDPAQLGLLLDRLKEVTGKEFEAQFLESGGVVVKPKLRLEGETSQSGGE